jgi:hypothetical protein
MRSESSQMTDGCVRTSVPPDHNKNKLLMGLLLSSTEGSLRTSQLHKKSNKPSVNSCDRHVIAAGPWCHSFLTLFLIYLISTPALATDSWGSSANGGGRSGGDPSDPNHPHSSENSSPDSQASNATLQRIVFDDQGFQIVYHLTNSFLYILTVTDDTSSNLNLTALVESVFQQKKDYVVEHWQDLAKYKIGFLVCVAVGE